MGFTQFSNTELCSKLLSMAAQTQEIELIQVVAQNIRVAMAARGISQNDLAKGMGLSKSALSQKMRGVIVWTLPDMQKAGEFLGIQPAVLLDPHGLLVAGHGFEPWTSGSQDQQ